MIDFKLVLLKNKPNAIGEYPIYLRLTKNREQKYLPTKVRCKEDEWDKDRQLVKSRSNRVKLNAELQEFKNAKESKYNNLNFDRREVLEIAELIELLTPRQKSTQTNDVFELFDNKIKRLNEAGKIGTERYYRETKSSLLKFLGTGKLKIEKITPQWLKDYEHHMRLRKCKDSGIAARMRGIRAIYNEAISNDIIPQEKYPFRDKYKISSLKCKINYRAISIDDMKKINDIDIESYPNLKLSKDLFLFSYYAGGINFKDMMLLKHSNITKDNKLIYVRSKTKGLFDFKLHHKALRIANYYKKNKINTDYIFPILLQNNLTPRQIDYRRQKMLTKFNRDLKEIGRLCEIDFELTSYVARHSMASNMKEIGVSTDIISEAMGHGNIQVTQVYLKKFGNEVVENAMDKLQ